MTCCELLSVTWWPGTRVCGRCSPRPRASPCQQVRCHPRRPSRHLAAHPTTEAELPDALKSAARYPSTWQPETPPRADLFELSAQEYVLLLVVHHIAGDGWSLGPLASDLTRAYTARVEGRVPEGVRCRCSMRTTRCGRTTFSGIRTILTALFATQIAYWTEALAGLPDQLTLPSDRPRPAVMSYRGDYVTVDMDADLHRRLSDVARASGRVCSWCCRLGSRVC